IGERRALENRQMGRVLDRMKLGRGERLANTFIARELYCFVRRSPEQQHRSPRLADDTIDRIHIERTQDTAGRSKRVAEPPKTHLRPVGVRPVRKTFPM